MKRTTVKLPDELDDRLRREAERLGVTVSSLTREAIEQFLTGERARGKRLAFTASGRSGRHDVSAKIEELLRSRAKR